MTSTASAGTHERIAARSFMSAVYAGSPSAAMYSSTLPGGLALAAGLDLEGIFFLMAAILSRVRRPVQAKRRSRSGRILRGFEYGSLERPRWVNGEGGHSVARRVNVGRSRDLARAASRLNLEHRDRRRSAEFRDVKHVAGSGGRLRAETSGCEEASGE